MIITTKSPAKSTTESSSESKLGFGDQTEADQEDTQDEDGGNLHFQDLLGIILGIR